MTLLLLFLTGLFAGTVDAIAGGGGLISLPALLSVGLPPHIAFGTNKLQGTIGTMVATMRYHRHGLISLSTLYRGLVCGLIGSVCGAIIGQVLNTQILDKIIPVLLLLILMYLICSPRLGHKDFQPRLSEYWFYLFFGFGLGLYDGFFGPGTGSIWVFALTFFLGYSLIKATAYTKVFNLNSSLVATICFAFGGNIDYRFALCMAAGQLIGARIGAHFAIKRGASLIRPVFLCVVTTTILSMLYKTYAHSVFFINLNRHYGNIPQWIIAGFVLLGIMFIYHKQHKKDISVE